MGIKQRYPDGHVEFLGRCHDAGQTRPTPPDGLMGLERSDRSESLRSQIHGARSGGGDER
jgi:hypothetical protein